MKIEQIGDVIVARLDSDYSGLDDEHLEKTQEQLFNLIDNRDRPLLVMDFKKTEFFSSTFIEVIFRVWNRVNRRSGKMALAGLQPLCLDILKVAKLDTLWTIYPSVDEAISRIAR